MAVVVDRANLSYLGEQRAIRLHLGGNRSRHEQQGGNAPSHFHRSLSQTRVMPFPAPGRSRAEPVGAHLSWTEDLNDGQACAAGAFETRSRADDLPSLAHSTGVDRRLWRGPKVRADSFRRSS